MALKVQSNKRNVWILTLIFSNVCCSSCDGQNEFKFALFTNELMSANRHTFELHRRVGGLGGVCWWCQNFDYWDWTHLKLSFTSFTFEKTVDLLEAKQTSHLNASQHLFATSASDYCLLIYLFSSCCLSLTIFFFTHYLQYQF